MPVRARVPRLSMRCAFGVDAVIMPREPISTMTIQQQSIRLITLYSNYKILWDPKDPMYLNKNKRDACWKQISLEMKLPVRELKKKMDSLLGSYRREKSREKKSRITGSGAGGIYTSKWFGYTYFNFMKNRNDPNGDTQDTIPIKKDQPSPRIFDPLIDIQDTSSTTNAEAPETFQEEQQIEDTSTCTISPQQPARKKRRNSKAQSQPDSAEMMLSEALRYLQKSSDEANDPYLSFGKHIANELTKYDPRTLSYVKNAINNIIFEADLGKYQQQQQATPGYCTQNVQSPASSSSTHISTPTPEDADASRTM